MIFVDTSAWYAALIQEDPSHDACRDLLNQSIWFCYHQTVKLSQKVEVCLYASNEEK